MPNKIILILAAWLIIVPLILVAQEGTTTATADEAITEPMEEQVPGLTVEAQICTDIVERMPVGGGDSFTSEVGKLYLWSRITGAQDSISIHHVWSYEGEEKLNMELPVKSPSWRAWTYKTILPEWTGQWEGKIIGPDGTIMATIPFQITKPTEKE